MKTQICLSILAMFLTSSAFAHNRGPLTVDKMSCSEAQAYTAKYKRYYKDVGPDGAIPIYPVLSIQELKVGRCYAAPILERTADNSHCIVGYYCNAY